MPERGLDPLTESRGAWLNSPPIDVATYVALLDHLNAAHRTVTAHVHDDDLPPRLWRVLDAIDLAIERTQQARVGADA